MIPAANTILTADILIDTIPSLNYAMQFKKAIISGKIDNLDAMRQVIFKILNTERYDYIIYSWNYGIELKDLYGMPYTYICPELERRITEALTQDDRIRSVTNFEFTLSSKNEVLVTFTVNTVYGDVETERTVAF